MTVKPFLTNSGHLKIPIHPYCVKPAIANELDESQQHFLPKVVENQLPNKLIPVEDAPVGAVPPAAINIT